MAIHPSVLAWRMPRTEETGGLQSLGLQTVRHHWVTKHIWTGEHSVTWHQKLHGSPGGPGDFGRRGHPTVQALGPEGTGELLGSILHVGRWTPSAHHSWLPPVSLGSSTKSLPGKVMGFPGGRVVKDPPANAGDLGPIPGSGRPSWEGMATHANILAPMDGGAWQAAVHGVTKMLDTTEWLNTHTHTQWTVALIWERKCKFVATWRS